MAFRLPALVLAAALAVQPALAHDAPHAGDRALAPADAQTLAIVDAARLFLDSLDAAQRQSAVFPFADQAQRLNWSNFPDPVVPRAGLRWGDLSGDQRAALSALLGTVLSSRGAEMVRLQMAADDANAVMHGGDAPPGRPKVNFGSDWYYVSFLGEPAADAPWTLQFGGHHLAINATVAGPHVTLTPTLTGGEPLKFTLEGQPVHLTGDEIAAARALLGSLDDAQRARAVVSDTRIGLVMGPGEEGRALPPEGLAGSAMTEAQKALLLNLIAVRVGILNDDDAGHAMADIAAHLDQTFFGWWGPVAEGEAAYVRVTGPVLLLEYSPEDMDGDPTDHAHNIWRDPTNDYGAGWVALK